MNRTTAVVLTLVLTVLATPILTRADEYIYTFTPQGPGFSGFATFSESSILTAPTTISNFSSDTIPNLASLLIAPEFGEECLGNLSPGPCIEANFSEDSGNEMSAFFYFVPDMTSPGTYFTSTCCNEGTLQISEVSAATPEPNSILLLGIGLIAGLWVRRKQISGRAARC